MTGSWEIINGDAVAESVFDWNKINVNYNLRYLGIVATDDTAVLNELVVQGPDGSVITPVNASDYPELFDEQDLFPVLQHCDGRGKQTWGSVVTKGKKLASRVDFLAFVSSGSCGSLNRH